MVFLGYACNIAIYFRGTGEHKSKMKGTGEQMLFRRAGNIES